MTLIPHPVLTDTQLTRVGWRKINLPIVRERDGATLMTLTWTKTFARHNGKEESLAVISNALASKIEFDPEGHFAWLDVRLD